MRMKLQEKSDVLVDTKYICSLYLYAMLEASLFRLEILYAGFLGQVWQR